MRLGETRKHSGGGGEGGDGVGRGAERSDGGREAGLKGERGCESDGGEGRNVSGGVDAGYVSDGCVDTAAAVTKAAMGATVREGVMLRATCECSGGNECGVARWGGGDEQRGGAWLKGVARRGGGGRDTENVCGGDVDGRGGEASLRMK